MGKSTGFLEFSRKNIELKPVEQRIKDYKEFDACFNEEIVSEQGARCMDCGVAFCHGDTGCPVDNLIPEFNDLVYKGRMVDALECLHSTNNFPEFTGRLCPAPCEGACTLGLIDDPVSIKAIERSIIDTAFANDWVKPILPSSRTDKKVAVIGSGPAGLTCAQQLNRYGHAVTVYEKADRPGGLLRYGIPDFKMEKWLVDRRVKQMEEEGVRFKTGVEVGVHISAEQLRAKYDAIVLAIGSEEPRDLKVPGRKLVGVHFAMDFLSLNNKKVAGDPIEIISAQDKNVIVIGGGDTGSDCVGTSNRHGAKSITQIELFPKPPAKRDPSTPWPLYPKMLKTSSSHEEGVDRRWSINTLGFHGDDKGRVQSIYGNEVTFKDGKFEPIPNSDFEWPADLVLLAMGFVHPVKKGLIDELTDSGMELDERGNVKAPFGTTTGCYATNLEGVYACGDARRGQSLIVWAISEGRKCARQVHVNLMA